MYDKAFVTRCNCVGNCGVVVFSPILDFDDQTTEIKILMYKRLEHAYTPESWWGRFWMAWRWLWKQSGPPLEDIVIDAKEAERLREWLGDFLRDAGYRKNKQGEYEAENAR